jgi:hypothetical protein
MVRWSVVSGFALCLGALSSAGCGDHAADLQAARGKAKPKTAPSGSASGLEQPPPGVLPPASNPPVGTQPPPATGACAPKQVNVANLTWRPPSALHQATCQQGEAMNLVNCYLGRSQQACDQPVNVECHRCVVSDPQIDQTFGPIIFDQANPGDVELNVEGCAAAVSGDVSANGCGPRLKMAEACKQQACATCQDPNQLAACLNAAATGTCAQYQQGAAQCAQFLQACGGSPTTANQAIQIGYQLSQLFCM